jgi:hypothetical protein
MLSRMCLGLAVACVLAVAVYLAPATALVQVP